MDPGGFPLAGTTAGDAPRGRIDELRELRAKLAAHRELVAGAWSDPLRRAVLWQEHARLRAAFVELRVRYVAAPIRAPWAQPVTAPTPAPEYDAWAPLSARERDVARLVAAGLTNRQIARQLHLSEGTAANHVRRMLLKLEFPSRARLAAWVVENPIRGSKVAPRAGSSP